MKNYYQYVVLFYYKDNNNEWQIETVDTYSYEQNIEKLAKKMATSRIELYNQNIKYIKIFKKLQEIEL